MDLRSFVTRCCTDNNNSPIDVRENDVYRVLSAHRRRLILSILAERGDGKVSVSELTRAVASRETGADPLGVPEDTFERIYVAITHTHLPVLAEANAVEWDRDAGLVYFDRRALAIAEVIRDIEQLTE